MDAGVAIGLPEALAKSAALKTVEGATLLAQQSEDDLKTLQAQVTSPKGTTEAAIKQFCDGGFEHIVAAAVKAAYERANELGKG
jgi:pyrroline-5-carboxylate reductase